MLFCTHFLETYPPEKGAALRAHAHALTHTHTVQVPYIAAHIAVVES